MIAQLPDGMTRLLLKAEIMKNVKVLHLAQQYVMIIVFIRRILQQSSH